MSKIFDYSGDDIFCPRGSIYPHPKECNLFLSLGHQVDVYFPPRKRSHISAPFVFSEEILEQEEASIEVLPDECLFEIFRRLPGGQERSSCACVSKHWLMLLSSICRDDICTKKTLPSLEAKGTLVFSNTEVDESLECNKKCGYVGSDGNKAEVLADDEDVEGDGYLSRNLEGKKATDVRLAAIAVGTGARGGLGKLSIRGSNSIREVTNVGLKAVARGCPTLRILSLWKLSSIGDEGLLEISNGCPLLEKLDLCQCPSISNKSLLAIAKKCPNLTSLTIESCSNIGNVGLQAIGSFCPKLMSVTIKNCPLVGDQGIAGLLSSAGSSLTKLRLQALNVSDVSLAVIGHYGKAVIDLALIALQNVSERGFWVMGNGQGLDKLRSFMITSCPGVTDLGLEAMAKGCPNLKQLCLSKCALFSDNGLLSFAKCAASLESLQLEECHRITQYGFFGLLLNCGVKLKAVALANCLGYMDMILGLPSMARWSSLRSLIIRNCPGFGDASLAMLGRICHQLQNVDFSGLHRITDDGLVPVVENNEIALEKVNLNGCVNLTDKVVSLIAKLHGTTLERLNLNGCRYITDASLVAIARHCSVLSEVDVSQCSITDSGIAALACAVQLNLQILSISGCSMVSDKSFPLLVKLGQTLVGLNIQHCNAMSSSTVDSLPEHLWQCDILS